MLRPVRATLAVSVICSLTACAKRHGKIEPTPIPPAAYSSATCRQLATMRATTMRALVLAGVAQDQHYADDRTRTFGVPTPMATIFEESRAPEIARLKGEVLALATQLERAGCVAREG